MTAAPAAPAAPVDFVVVAAVDAVAVAVVAGFEVASVDTAADQVFQNEIVAMRKTSMG